jgi:hypothetical protein
VLQCIPAVTIYLGAGEALLVKQSGILQQLTPTSLLLSLFQVTPPPRSLGIYALPPNTHNGEEVGHTFWHLPAATAAAAVAVATAAAPAEQGVSCTAQQVLPLIQVLPKGAASLQCLASVACKQMLASSNSCQSAGMQCCCTTIRFRRCSPGERWAASEAVTSWHRDTEVACFFPCRLRLRGRAMW